MSNLLEQYIDSADGEQAARIDASTTQKRRAPWIALISKSAHRLQGDLRGTVWIEAQIEKAIRLLSDRPILRKIASGLPH